MTDYHFFLSELLLLGLIYTDLSDPDSTDACLCRGSGLGAVSFCWTIKGETCLFWSGVDEFCKILGDPLDPLSDERGGPELLSSDLLKNRFALGFYSFSTSFPLLIEGLLLVFFLISTEPLLLLL